MPTKPPNKPAESKKKSKEDHLAIFGKVHLDEKATQKIISARIARHYLGSK